MILQLNQETFQLFGIILPETKVLPTNVNSHSICLYPDSTSVYETTAETTLCNSQGLTILSVWAEDGHVQNFYMDKPLKLHGGIRFSLTAFQNVSTITLSAVSTPRLLQTHAATGGFSTRPRLQVQEVYTLFYQEKEQGFLFPGESHSMLELTYVDRGTLHSVADGLDLLLQQGDMVLYAPGQWHMQYADIGVAPRYVTISFHATGRSLEPLTNRVIHPSRKAIDHLQQLLREQELPDETSGDTIIHLLELLLLSLLREDCAPADKLQAAHCINAENEIIRRAQQYISANVQQKLSVPVVARSVDVSTSYLTALFHKHLQISPGEYIRRIKLQESKQLIREGRMNFTEIAEVLQYSTVHHFSRQFKEKFGITPTEYAKSVR